mmetsp:Transcript_38665/g.58021  ORF Transcript_38665/g.58021 Transcript_38665/m.58021 type:complete len:282 (-) Transcript_38665:1130-1975(-)
MFDRWFLCVEPVRIFAVDISEVSALLLGALLSLLPVFLGSVLDSGPILDVLNVGCKDKFASNVFEVSFTITAFSDLLFTFWGISREEDPVALLVCFASFCGRSVFLSSRISSVNPPLTKTDLSCSRDIPSNSACFASDEAAVEEEVLPASLIFFSVLRFDPSINPKLVGINWGGCKYDPPGDVPIFCAPVPGARIMGPKGAPAPSRSVPGAGCCCCAPYPVPSLPPKPTPERPNPPKNPPAPAPVSRCRLATAAGNAAAASAGLAFITLIPCRGLAPHTAT